MKGHSRDIVKECVHSYKDENNEYDLGDFHIMAGGITPEGQPIDKFMGKIFQGYNRDYYDVYMLTIPTDSKGQFIKPSRQLCAQRVVKAWDMIPEKLIRKAWDLCGYKSATSSINLSVQQEIIGRVETDEGVIQQQLTQAVGNDEAHRVLQYYLDPENIVEDHESEDE